MLRLRMLSLFIALGVCSATAAQDLPKAEEIMDRYVQVTGGKDAYLKLKNRKVTGRMVMAAAGINGKMTIYQEGKKLRTSIDLPGIGLVEQFCDGTNVGEVNPISGARILEGEERSMILRQAHFQADVEWRKLYPKAKCTGTKVVNGNTCYVVELETPEGFKTTKFFDKETGLLAGENLTYKSNMGDISVESVTVGYKTYDGIKFPVETKMLMMSQEMMMKVDAVEHNVTLPAGIFELPPDLKKKLGNQDK